MLQLAQLRDICTSANGKKACEIYLPYLNEFMPKYLINTMPRIAMFLSQVLVESEEFTHLSENLNYSAQGLANTWPLHFKNHDGTPNDEAKILNRNPVAIANFIYADRLGNGDESSGDGWLFRGQGLIDLTGREVITLCGNDIGVDLENYPDKLQEPAIATESACWFWSDYKKLNPIADSGDFKKVCERTNGGDIGLKARTDYWEACKNVITSV